ncbi:ATP-binding cassette domain-containing protein [Amylibacter sp. SFDW26]|uniref:ATP-binding cassette domain-containing protein n=1 Tax=Amylibacter sp. SFDW26 TaxID=2652722 RepID=UPI001261DF90|nr:ATP-binding cassette domain-containing protein [Amylibacter sp. SFDW26]KAB7616223.1 ATP-binding cassette domain-containing protein [Amylibacter sp. SFDW26]
MTQLTIENLNYTSDDARLLKDINISHKNNGITAIIGANGAGKSLLLSILHGLIAPTSGRVAWDGASATKGKNTRGYVFQKPIILRRSVRDNLAYPLKVQNHPKTGQAEAIDQMLELSQLSHLADQPAASLSGGEAQRMTIARALITQPKTLLLDEPCSNLDPASTKLIENMIHSFVAGDGSVYISTHDMAQAKRLSNVVFFLEAGQLLEHKAAKDFFAAPTTREGRAYLNGDL